MLLNKELLDAAGVAFGGSTDEIPALVLRNSQNSAIALDGLSHVESRKNMLALTSIDAVENAYERYIDGNQLLSINYLAQGVAKSKSVGLLSWFDKRERRPGRATGFLVTPRLLMTNHHVFSVVNADEFQARFENVCIEFDYELGLDGRPMRTTKFDLDASSFFLSNQSLDMALVAVKETDVTGAIPLRSRGYLVLNGEIGKAGDGDFATVIQHANGGYQQISLRGNEIVKYKQHDQQLFYKSDTQLGSSGSAVFNDEWQVIALHSAGVAKTNAAGLYIDADDQIIEVSNGKLDSKRLVWECNRGYRISAIMGFLHQQTFNPKESSFVKEMFTRTYSDSRDVAYLSYPASDEKNAATQPVAQRAAVTLPPPLQINVAVNVDGRNVDMSVPVAFQQASKFLPPEIGIEGKYEDELDLSGCAGYQQDFMGIRIPLPKPSPELRQLMAFRNDRPNSYVLHYHHFSSMHHSVRRVPVLSAININAVRRYKELSDRDDKWFRDNRIDYDVQLDDAWYKYSGFDRGHLSRREDAEWGVTVDFAETAANLTCSYANAAPQVAGFNRYMMQHRGKWGKLEKELLEKGVTLEGARAGKICVFNGPIFRADDPAFKGVQVALEFFKVVAWFDATGELRTTCFCLTQKNQVGDIEFEALAFDTLFVDEQRSLAYVEEATGLIFPEILRDSDTFGIA